MALSQGTPTLAADSYPNLLNTHPLTQYDWRTEWTGIVLFRPDGSLFIQPTTELPANHMMGTWSLNSETSIRTRGFFITEMAVPDQSMELEQTMSDILGSRNDFPFRFEPVPGHLDSARVIFGDMTKGERTFTLTGRMFPEIRYGPGEIEFYEIRPSSSAERTQFGTPFVLRQVEGEVGSHVSNSNWKPYLNQITNLHLAVNEAARVRVKRITIPAEDDTASPQLVYFLDEVLSNE